MIAAMLLSDHFAAVLLPFGGFGTGCGTAVNSNW
jgi:hypothetical protein